MMRLAFAFVGHVTAVLGPVMPGRWTRLAMHFARGPGWVSSTMLCCTFGIAVFVNSLVNLWVNGLVADVINVATWGSWVVVSCFAMLIAISRSVRNLFRMGVFAGSRSRYWFECAATAWNSAILVFLVTFTVSWAAAACQAPLVEAHAWQSGRVLTLIGLCTFATAGTVGYGISFVQRRWPTGRASECTHFFLLMPVGCGGLIAAVEHWPIARIWPDSIIVLGGGLIAVLAIGGAIIFCSKGLGTSWRRNDINQSC